LAGQLISGLHLTAAARALVQRLDLARCLKRLAQIALHRLRPAIDNMISAKIACEPLQSLHLLAHIPELVGHHYGCHQEQPVILDGLRAALDPLNMRIDFGCEVLNASLFALAAPHPETAPVYDYYDLGHCPALLRPLEASEPDFAASVASARIGDGLAQFTQARHPTFSLLAHGNKEKVKPKQCVNHNLP
jgi:hypothetical protein